jgi:hypothetical protein
VSYSMSLPPEVEEFLRTYGTEQIGRPLPRRWRRRHARTPGDCYAKAGRWCVGEPVMYTEGRALSAASPRGTGYPTRGSLRRMGA